MTKVGDIDEPVLQPTAVSNLALLPGDLALAGFEDFLSSEWPNALGSGPLYRPFRILTAFWQAAQKAALKHQADVIVFDVGPNLGAINRSAILASDYIAVPLGADLFSLQGLSNLGPAVKRWRGDWRKRIENWKPPEFEIPHGNARPIGYVVQQHSVRLDRPVKAFDKWIKRIPEAYSKMVLEIQDGTVAASPEVDDHCLATLKHFRSLIPMAEEKRKPIFELTAADGAIGNHARLVDDARNSFERLSRKIAERINLPLA